MQNTYLVLCWASCKACRNRPRTAHAGTKRYAIIGGGFAGAATAHYLAATASVVRPVTIHLYDIAGLVSNINVLHSLLTVELNTNQIACHHILLYAMMFLCRAQVDQALQVACCIHFLRKAK